MLATGFRYLFPPALPSATPRHGLQSPRGRRAQRGGGSSPVKGKEELPEKLEAEEAEQEDREIAAPEEEAEASTRRLSWSPPRSRRLRRLREAMPMMSIS
ncbi:hypothetical protein NL676_000987 [Syzygium grande]|nr:hypothetical protein NL676_000987 [Syzygium grande]